MLLISVLALTQLQKLQIDNSNETFFTFGDVTKQRLDKFKATFGNDDFVFLLIDADSVLNPRLLARVDALAERLSMDVPHLLELTWLGNVEHIEGIPGGILIDSLFPKLDISTEELRRIGEQAMGDPAYQNRLIASDGTALGLLLEFENYPDIGIDPRKDSPPVIETIVREFADLNIHIVGSPYLDHKLDEYTAQEAPLWLGGALLGMCAMLLITTRSLSGLIVPAVTVLLAVLWTMGLVAAAGFTLNLLVILVPTLLLCVGIGDTMHVVAELRQEMATGKSSREALRETISLVSRPLLLTTLTTAIGFLGFLATDLIPVRELGIQAAIGVLIAYLLTFLFAVPVLSYLPDQEKLENNDSVFPKTDCFDWAIKGLSGFVIDHKRGVAASFLALTVLAMTGMSRLELETNTIQDLPRTNPLRSSFDYVDERMGGGMSIEFVVDTGQPGGIKNPGLLLKVDAFQQFLSAHPLVTQTTSIIDQLKQMHRAIHENSNDAYKLPMSGNQIAEYFLLYESGGGSQLDQYVAFTYDQLRVQVRTKTLNVSQVQSLEQDAAAFISATFDDDITVYSTGTLPMFERLTALITQGQRASVSLALFAIGIVMMLTLRSVKLGLIAMLPNILPVAFALGAMGWVGAQLNIVAMILGPMILGVAVDDTVHFFLRFRRYFDEVQDYDAAYRKTMRTVGRPLLFTTLVLITGFSGFLLSDFAGPVNFGWASMVAFSSALLAEFMLVPVLLSWFRPLDTASKDRPTLTAAARVR